MSDKKEEDTLRHHYYVAAQMHGSDEKSIGGLNVNTSGRHDTAAAVEEKRKQSTDDAMFLAMLEQSLAQIETAMIEKYGEDFAEQLAAGYLDKETYQALMKIEDAEERRRAIALAINEGIENGTIDLNDIYKNPDVRQWLEICDEVSKAQRKQEMTLAFQALSSADIEQSSTQENNEALEKGLDNFFS